jgi:hypothetical protein
VTRFCPGKKKEFFFFFSFFFFFFFPFQFLRFCCQAPCRNLKFLNIIPHTENSTCHKNKKSTSDKSFSTASSCRRKPTLIVATTRPIILDGIILPVTTKPIPLDGLFTLPPKTIVVETTKPPIFVTKPPIFDGIILPTKFSIVPGSTTAAPASASNVYAESSSAPPLVLPSVAPSYGESATAPQYSVAATSSSKYVATDVEKAASDRGAVDANGNPIHSGIEANSASQQMASLLIVVIIVLFHVAF